MESPTAGQFDRDHLTVMRQGIVLFNTRYYWECHEELEHHWLEARGDNARYVYWAVIQVAAALVHYETKNLTGVQGMLKKAREKIRQVQLTYVESDLLRYNLDWTRSSELVLSSPVAGEIADYEPIYRYQFPHPDSWRYE